MWEGDSVTIPFSHEKCNQKGEDKTKRLPRHCYSNPLDWSADFTSSVFHYLVAHPEQIAQADNSLLVGSQESQGTKFNNVLNKVLDSHRDEDGLRLCESKFGYKIEDLTMYSLRKFAHTQLNCGSTAGPTSAAACLREGKSLGHARNPYIAVEGASDQFTSRILAGLQINLPEFTLGSKYTKSLFCTFGNVAKNDFLLPKTLINM